MGARELLEDLTSAGFVVTADRDNLIVRPASKLTPDLRAAVVAAKPDLLALLRPVDLSGIAWGDSTIRLFQTHLERLMRWGWPTGEAEEVADRLTRRDADDDRVSCIDCRHFRIGKCMNAVRAGLAADKCGAIRSGVEVGRDLAGMLQRCHGFANSV